MMLVLHMKIRMNRLILSLLFSVCLLIIFSTLVQAAPAEQWNKTFGGAYSDIGNSVQQTSDGGYIIAGYTDSYGAGGSDAWLIKVDSNGNQKWNKTFGEAYSDGVNSVQQTSDGGYIIAGYTDSFGDGNRDAWLIKVDSNGKQEWDKIFGGTSYDIANSVQQTSDGGYIVAGCTYSYETGSDAWLIKVDINGSKKWSTSYGGTSSDSANSVLQTSDGGYIIAGYTYSYGAGGSDAWLIKVDSNGYPKWNQAFGGAYSDVAKSVQQTSDGGYIITGYTANSYGADYYDACLIKVDSNGKQEWDKTFGGAYSDIGNSVQQTSDGGYIITGYTINPEEVVVDAWLMNVDSNGNQKWNKTFSGVYFDIGNSVQQTSDGGYIIAGETESYGAGGSDAWLIKVARETDQTIDKPPVLAAIGNKTVNVNSLLSFIISATDPDGDKIAYYATGLPSGAQFNATTGKFTWTPTAIGKYSVKFSATANGQTDDEPIYLIVTTVSNTVSYAPTYDNRLRSDSASTVLSTSTYLDVGRTSSTARDVMVFDLSSYKTTDTISKATLSLYWYYPASTIRTSDTVVEVYRPVEWDPKYVSWNSRTSGTPWTTAGGSWFDKNGVSQGATPYASLTFPAGKMPDNKYYEFDVTSLVQEYASGKYKNTGFFIKAKTESGNYIAFYSADASNTAVRPKLTVTSTSGSAPTDSAPVANAGADKTSTVGSAVTFDASASTDDKGIASYSWDFDSSNGITSEASTVSATKTYTTAGTYTVTLTVTDTIGQKSTDTLQVIVSTATTPVSTVSYAPIYDNRLRESSATTVLATTAYIDIGKTTSSYRDVMLFNLSSYKTTDTISKATLSLYWYYPAGATRTSDTIVDIYRPIEWDPKYVTWNSRMSGTPWSTAGGNWFDKNAIAQGSTPYASMTFAGSSMPDNKYYEFDVTQLVQEYVSGKYKNTGFFLKAKTESGNYIAFYSSEYSNSAMRPKLTVTSVSGSTAVDNPPVANAGADKTATIGSSVTFDASTSTDDKGIASYSWDFDASNGITSDATTKIATKTYTTAGIYTVTLTVADTIGQKSTDTLQVVVNSPIDQLPVANAGSDKTATTSSVVTFDGSASTDDKGITSYSWDFDASNGITSEATGVMTAKAYTTAGTYTVTLTVTDAIGQKSSDTLQVDISNPVSSVSYTPLYDNRLRDASPTTVLSTTTYLDIGKSSSTCRDLMLFNLSSYKTTDTISKATLSLYWYYPAGATRTSDTVVEIYRPVEWDPKYVTWNSRMSGVLWSNVGGNWYDRNGVAQGTTPYASLAFAGSKVPDNKYYEFDVTSLVQDYISGKYKNTGFFLKAKTESGNYIAFYSLESSNAAVRPKLTITR